MIVAMAPLCWYAANALHRAATLIERRDSSSLLSAAHGGARVFVTDYFDLAAALYGRRSFLGPLFFWIKASFWSRPERPAIFTRNSVNTETTTRMVLGVGL